MLMHTDGWQPITWQAPELLVVVMQGGLVVAVHTNVLMYLFCKYVLFMQFYCLNHALLGNIIVNLLYKIFVMLNI